MNKDELVMMNILSLLKGVSDLYLHGNIEAACPKVEAAFKKVLVENLTLQSEVFAAMKEKGWYQIPVETKKNLDKTVKKYASGA